MAKKDRYTVLNGFNCPDPSGARDENGAPKEVRFETGAEIGGDDVLPASLKTLLQVGAVRQKNAPADEPPINYEPPIN